MSNNDKHRVLINLTTEELNRVSILASLEARKTKNWIEHVIREYLKAHPVVEQAHNIGVNG